MNRGRTAFSTLTGLSIIVALLAVASIALGTVAYARNQQLITDNEALQADIAQTNTDLMDLIMEASMQVLGNGSVTIHHLADLNGTLWRAVGPAVTGTSLPVRMEVINIELVATRNLTFLCIFNTQGAVYTVDESSTSTLYIINIEPDLGIDVFGQSQINGNAQVPGSPQKITVSEPGVVANTFRVFATTNRIEIDLSGTIPIGTEVEIRKDIAILIPLI